jgi:hypothetical protein
MKILLDECPPRKLKREFTGHEVRTVPEMGWAGVKNGELMKRAEVEFDLFVTIDGNLEHQQNLRNRALAVVVLCAPNNTFNALSPLVPAPSPHWKAYRRER